jgi:hypothetical protein
MRSFTSIPLWAFVFASVSTLVGAVAIDEQCKAEICMGGQNIARTLPASPVANVGRELLTNAERLSHGLPPKAPTRRMHAGELPSPCSPFLVAYCQLTSTSLHPQLANRPRRRLQILAQEEFG